jgi:hypothetical protein
MNVRHPLQGIPKETLRLVVKNTLAAVLLYAFIIVALA